MFATWDKAPAKARMPGEYTPSSLLISIRISISQEIPAILLQPIEFGVLLYFSAIGLLTEVDSYCAAMLVLAWQWFPGGLKFFSQKPVDWCATQKHTLSAAEQ